MVSRGRATTIGSGTRGSGGPWRRRGGARRRATGAGTVVVAVAGLLAVLPASSQAGIGQDALAVSRAERAVAWAEDSGDARGRIWGFDAPRPVALHEHQ